jgi:hypothetical protein
MVCKILDQDEVKPHKVRYYLEQRDPESRWRRAKGCRRCTLPLASSNSVD